MSGSNGGEPGETVVASTICPTNSSNSNSVAAVQAPGGGAARPTTLLPAAPTGAGPGARDAFAAFRTGSSAGGGGSSTQTQSSQPVNSNRQNLVLTARAKQDEFKRREKECSIRMQRALDLQIKTKVDEAIANAKKLSNGEKVDELIIMGIEEFKEKIRQKVGGRDVNTPGLTEEQKQEILLYQDLEGFNIVELKGLRQANTSPMWSTGVVVEKDFSHVPAGPEREAAEKAFHGPRRFYCMCSDQGHDCRNNFFSRMKGKHWIAAPAKSTSGPLEHIRNCHGIDLGKKGQVSVVTGNALTDRAYATQEKRLDQDKILQDGLENELFKKHPQRFLEDVLVKSMIIEDLNPFNLFESNGARYSFGMVNAMPDLDGSFKQGLFDPSKLHNKKVKHRVTEFYDDLLNKIRAEIAEKISTRTRRDCFSFNVDIWECKTSGKKFLGLYLFWFCDVTKKRKSRVIAIKLYDPSIDCINSDAASERIRLWIDQVLAELGLTHDDIFGCNTDDGSEIKRYRTQLSVDSTGRHGLSDHCLCHDLNNTQRAMCGENSGRNSSNTDAKKILTQLREIVSHVSRSSTSEAFMREEQEKVMGTITSFCMPSATTRGVDNRWSSFSPMLQAILINWKIFKKLHIDQLRKQWFADHDIKKVVELYSFMQPFRVAIQQLQSDNPWCGATAYTNVLNIRLSTLNELKPLKVLQPHLEFEARLTHAKGLQDGTISPFDPAFVEGKHTVIRSHTDLGMMMQTTRRIGAAAFDDRHIAKFESSHSSRGPDAPETDLFISPHWLQILLSPPLAHMKQLDLAFEIANPELSDTSTPSIFLAKVVFRRRLFDFMIKQIATVIRALAPQGEEAPKKRRRQMTPQEIAAFLLIDPDWAEPEDSENDDSGMSEDDGQNENEETILRQATDEWNKYYNWAKLQHNTGVGAQLLNADNLGEFWINGDGNKNWPHLARFACDLSAWPISAGFIERVFSCTSRVVPSWRASMTPEMEEMMFLLHCSVKLDIFPDHPATLSRDEAVAALPKRLTDRDQIKAIIALDQERMKLLEAAWEDELRSVSQYPFKDLEDAVEMNEN